MLLACPQCDAKYEVPDDAIPPEGRDVECSNCGHGWFQPNESDKAGAIAPAPADSIEDDAEYDDAEAALMAALMMDEDDAPNSVPPPPRKIDESVLAVLREEADRESEARARDRASRRKELQPEDPTFALPPLGAASTARRDLLPDVEEINSSLQPDPLVQDQSLGQEAGVAKGAPLKAGFFFGLILAIVAGALYLKNAELIQALPALAEPLTSYKVAIDQLIEQLR